MSRPLPSRLAELAPSMHCRVSGPHPDYYLLMDEQAEAIFASRLAARRREANVVCDARDAAAAADLIDIWIDEGEKHVWYVFEVCRP